MKRSARTFVFFVGVFAVWAMVLFFRYGRYHYFDTPLPTAGHEYKDGGGISNKEFTESTLHTLKVSLLVECRKEDFPHLLSNIGIGYFNIYWEKRDPKVLDTVIFYLSKSVDAAPDNPRFHYNLGRAFSEFGDHEKALYHYEQTIEFNPRHVLAISNAGMLELFVFKHKERAVQYLIKALAIDSLIPMCRLMLGAMCASEKKYEEARRYYEAEIAAGQKSTGNNYPLSGENIRQAAKLSRFSLFELYSRQIRDRDRALKNYHEYLLLEQDEKRKNEALAVFRKYWGREAP